MTVVGQWETFPTRKKATRRPPLFESQTAYLNRHKLLSDDEREALPGDAFEPVAYVPD
jgi:hypothetical protein